jgi:DNA-binding response OmpR family regulator
MVPTIQSALEKRAPSPQTRSQSTTEGIAGKDFDLVITDLLPVLEKAKELNPETMAILILAMSSKLIPTAHAIRSSPDDYLFRPFELAELEMRVSRIDKRTTKKKSSPMVLNKFQ